MSKKHYCCEMMEKTDKDGVIDYCPGHMTSIESEKVCYGINFCPFCGTPLPGTEKSFKRVEKYFGVGKQ